MTLEIHGTCEPGFEPLKAALAANFADGFEIGASLAATVRGRPVLDVWAGHADVARTRPWARDTIVNVRSSTKIVLQVMVLMLVERGRIALDAPVADYWPAFAQGGKGEVTIRDVLAHRSGVPGLTPPPADMSPYLDWDGITARIAAEPHWFAGEPRIAYQMVTSGFILGEVMRRVDGRLHDSSTRKSARRPAASTCRSACATHPSSPASPKLAGPGRRLTPRRRTRWLCASTRACH